MQLRALPLLLAGAMLTLPPVAQAGEPGPVCPAPAGSAECQAALTPLMGGVITATGPLTPGGGAQAAARQALGAQYTGLWLDTARQGWSVAFAPGPLDAGTARTAIRSRLAEQFTADQVAFLDSKLNLFADEYSEAELEAVRVRISALAPSSGFNLSYAPRAGAEAADPVVR